MNCPAGGGFWPPGAQQGDRGTDGEYIYKDIDIDIDRWIDR